jgi:hypothetical protein
VNVSDMEDPGPRCAFYKCSSLSGISDDEGMIHVVYAVAERQASVAGGLVATGTSVCFNSRAKEERGSEIPLALLPRGRGGGVCVTFRRQTNRGGCSRRIATFG